MKSLALLAAMALPLAAHAQTDPADWDAVAAAAKGQTVYWNAWGGSTTTNDFIAWIGDKVRDEYGVTLEHVKLTDTADAVTRVLAEKQAGTDTRKLCRDEGRGPALWPLRRTTAELAICRCRRQDRADRLYCVC